MAEMKNLSRKGQKYYVLLKERTAEKRDKVYNTTRNNKKCVTLLQGEILYRNLNSKAVDENAAVITLQPYGRDSYFSQCPVQDVEQVDEEEAMLLLSITSLGERFKLHKSESLKNAKRMTVGSPVYVNFPSLKKGLKGVIKYKGPSLDQYGETFPIIFGVELTEGAGRGTTNGFFKGVQHFKCETDCGVFVSFEKLTMCEDFVKVKNNENHVDTKDQDDVNNDGILNKVSKLKNKVTESISNLVFGAQENSLEQSNKTAQHKEGERVWVYIPVDDKGDKLFAGYIRYIGRIPGHDGTLAGIQLDHPVGQGDGDWYGKQLFSCPMNHAHFTRIEHVISEEKLQELYEQPNNDSLVNKASLEAKHSSVPQSSQDIINMESSFSKQSTDQVVKEQQKLYEKFKQEGEQKRTDKRNLEESRSGNEAPLVQRWTNYEKPSKVTHISQKTVQVNPRRVPRSPASTSAQPKNIPLQSNLDVGSMVEILSKLDKPRYGVIRWTGFVPDVPNKIAGVELEEEMNGCADGTFLGKRYFTCPNRRGLFIHLHNCVPDSRFNKNSMENAARKRLTGTEFGPYESPIIQDDFVPPCESLEIYLKQDARGIQGHHNSCYLDATLFGAFAFSSIMDSILLREKDEKDIEQYEKVQSVLRDNIVYPLRAHGFVRADRVFELRELLDRLGTVTGLVGEEKDPEEFLLTLLQQVLKSEPFLKIRSGKEVRHEYFYQVLADKDVERVLPSVEELLKRSFYQSGLKLTEVPSCLIVQMPRFGKGFKMYNRILPSLTINIGELVDNYPQDCAVCGRLAKHYCKDCFNVSASDGSDCSGNFCKDCNERTHSHVKRNKHNHQPIAVSREICTSYADGRAVEHRDMELFAVICIETSHYVAFTKCEQADGVVRWCFFDSMADRVGTKNGYNVPSVVECPEVVEWLSLEKQNRERIINTNDKEMPDRVRRLLGDAYVCLYESKEMAMYK